MKVQLSAIVLAAGFSRRVPGGRNKLLDGMAGGATVLQRVVHSIVAGAQASEILVVTGHQAPLIEASLAGFPVRFVRLEQAGGGMGCSLAAGVQACASGTAGFLVCPGDLPWLRTDSVRALVAGFEALGGLSHVRPLWQGQPGHPVVLGSWLRPDLERLQGDEGARRLLALEAEQARTQLLELGDPGVCRDVDRGISPGEFPNP